MIYIPGNMLFSIPYRLLPLLLFIWIAQPLTAGKRLSPEERTIVDAASHPWNAIGRVNRAGTGHCTGVLITPSHVLTAAHCLWNPRTGQPLPVTELHFLAGYQKGRYVAHGRVKSLFINPHYNPDISDHLKRAETDWAIINLTSPLSGVKPLPLMPLNRATLQKLHKSGNKIEQAGYSRDWQYVLTRDDDCVLHGFIEGKKLLAHSCRAIGGDSGSPLIANDGKRRLVIAIHVGRAKENERELGLAVPGGVISGWKKESVTSPAQR